MSYPTPKQPWRIVARREIMVQLTDKTFWISTAVMLVMIAVGLGASYLFNQPPEKILVGITDDSGAEVISLASELSGQVYETERYEASQLRDAVEAGDVSFGLEPSSTGWTLWAKDFTSMRNSDGLEAAITQYATSKNAERLGIDLAELHEGSDFRVKISGEQGAASDWPITWMAGMIFAVLFFMSAMLYGLQIAQSAVAEKESRIVEILTSAIPSRQLLIGKVVGNSVMALGQLLLFISMSCIAVSLTDWRQLLPMIAPSIGWFIAFFLAGFAALGCLWAAAGAMATRLQDVNQTTTPLMMILMFAYFSGFFASGITAKVLSYVPILSSVLMPQRLLTGDASWLDATVALLLVLAFMWVAIRVGDSIYRRGILKTSGVMKFKEIFSRDS